MSTTPPSRKTSRRTGQQANVATLREMDDAAGAAALGATAVGQALSTPAGQAEAAQLRSRFEKMVGKVVQQAGYAVLTMAGPFGELVELPMDALVDANKTLEVAKPALSLAAQVEHTPSMKALLNTVPLAVPEVVAAVKAGKLTPQMEHQIAERVANKALGNPQIAQHAAEIAAMPGRLTQDAANTVNTHIARGMGVEVHPKLRQRPVAPVRRVSTQRAGGRRRRRRSHCPRSNPDGTGLKVVHIPGNKRPVYRWVVRIRPDGRLEGKAPKAGARIRELCLLNSGDWGSTQLLPEGSRVHKRPSQTSRRTRRPYDPKKWRTRRGARRRMHKRSRRSK